MNRRSPRLFRVLVIAQRRRHLHELYRMTTYAWSALRTVEQ